MTSPADIARALGKQLWTTHWFVPSYKPGANGAWRIDPGGQLGHDWGYYSGPCVLELLPSLARRVRSSQDGDPPGWETWMALTPHEIESQELAIRHARGNVVVMGLGMGWVAANIALQSAVDRVTVIERDPEVIELFEECGAAESLPAQSRSKLHICHGDALQWRAGGTGPVDFLYADIWLNLANSQSLNEVRKMQQNLGAGIIYYWGQELAIYNAIELMGVKITTDNLQRAITSIIDLPLLLPEDIDYATMIRQVIQNRVSRNLPIEVSV